MAVQRQPMKPGESNVAGTQAAVAREHPVRAGQSPLRDLLVGGDRRSIARSNEALTLLRADRARVGELVRLVHDGDWLVAMRAIDLMEKLAHERPEWVQPHRGLFIGPLAEHPSWEIRLQIARALPLLRWTPTERERVVTLLLGYARQPRKFVKAWALDSLARLAEHDGALMAVVESLIREFERSESPALISRARQICKHLQSLPAGTKKPPAP